MKAVALTPGHDGTITLIADGCLEFSLEAEKDSFNRHERMSATLMFEALQRLDETPDIMALGGWFDVVPGKLRPVGAGYRGLEPGPLRTAKIFGHELQLYSCSHERSHIIASVAMSPFASDQPLAVLVWEGQIGAFYEWHGPSSRSSVATSSTSQARVMPRSRASRSSVSGGRISPHRGRWQTHGPRRVQRWQRASEESRLVVDSLLQSRALYPFNKARYRRSTPFTALA